MTEITPLTVTQILVFRCCLVLQGCFGGALGTELSLLGFCGSGGLTYEARFIPKSRTGTKTRAYADPWIGAWVVVTAGD